MLSEKPCDAIILDETNCVKKEKKSRSDSSTKQAEGSKRVLYLVALQSWDLLRSFFSTHQGRKHAKAFGLETDGLGRTALHLACCATGESRKGLAVTTAPPDVIELLIDVCPAAVRSVDNNGQTPLHLAASALTKVMPVAISSWRVISVLLDRYSQAAGIQDNEGKTPLVVLCEKLVFVPSSFSSKSYSNGVRIDNNRVLLSIIEMLCNASPGSIATRDASGVTAKEYAIVADADPRIVKILSESLRNTNENKPPGRAASPITPRRQVRRWSSVDTAAPHALQACMVQQRRTSLSPSAITGVPSKRPSLKEHKRQSWSRRTSSLLSQIKRLDCEKAVVTFSS